MILTEMFETKKYKEKQVVECFIKRYNEQVQFFVENTMIHIHWKRDVPWSGEFSFICCAHATGD